MKLLLQRVTHASVEIDGETVASVGVGFLVLVGCRTGDTVADADYLADRMVALRVFCDEEGRMNRSLADIGGEVLVVSQFTLYADCRRGNRPSFTGAAGPELGERLYEHFCSLAAAEVPCGHGVFGADMQVSLVNDGPVTIWLDTDELSRSRRSS